MSYEISEMFALDVSVGAFLAKAFDGFAANQPEGFAKFVSRDPKSRVVRCDHDTPTTLLRRISEGKKGDAGTGGKIPALPFIAYYRKPGIVSGDDKARVVDQTVWTEEGRAIKISILPVTVDYNITFVASDKLTLDKMQLAWYSFISKGGRRTSRFEVPYKIAGEINNVGASVLDPKTVMFSDASLEREDRRVFAVDMAITINTQVLIGEAVTPITEIEIWGITTSYITSSYTV